MKTTLFSAASTQFAVFTFALGLLAPCGARAAGVVTSPTEANLRAAMAGGGTVTFATDGTITLSAVLEITNNTLVDAASHVITLSGSNYTRIFLVDSNVQFTLNNLTVANGKTNQGAGLYNAGGTVSISNVIFAANQTVGTNGISFGGYATDGEPAIGGSIYNAGALSLLGCQFLTNSNVGGNGGSIIGGAGASASGGVGIGGGIYNSGSVILLGCRFVANSSVGGDVGYNGGGFYVGFPGGGSGGAIFNSGSLTLLGCQFVANTTVGGVGAQYAEAAGIGGVGAGGALYNTGTLAATNCAFTTNGATGGLGGYPLSGCSSGGDGVGGAVYSTNQVALANCTFAGNRAMGGAFASQPNPNCTFGNCLGGGLWNQGGTVTISNCSFVGNDTGPVVNRPGIERGGGLGSSAGSVSIVGSLFASNSVFIFTGSGGAIYIDNGVGTLTLSSSTLSFNYSGSAGGGLFNAATASVVNCTIANNTSYDGGGIYNTNGSLTLTNCTLSGNSATIGGNIAQASALMLINTILNAGVSNNAFGSLTDLGHNLSSDSSCGFSASGSLNNTDPKLQPLAYNGGPTPTMALTAGSPAIGGAISLPGITTDQRGVPRPYGPEPDIGSYEWNTSYSNFSLTSVLRSNSSWYISGVGPTNQNFRLRVSSNLVNWVDLSTNNTGPFG